MGVELYRADGTRRVTPNPRIARPYPMHLNTGGSIGGVEYIAGCENCSALSTLALVANTLYMIPFVSPPYPTYCEALALEVTATAGTLLMLALWSGQELQAACEGTLNQTQMDRSYGGGQLVSGVEAYLPGNFIVSENVGMTVAVKRTTSPSAANRKYLWPNQLYWVGVVSDGAPTVRAVAVGGIEHAGLVTAGTTALICGLSGVGVTPSYTDGLDNGGGKVPLAVRTGAVMPAIRYQLIRGMP